MLKIPASFWIAVLLLAWAACPASAQTVTFKQTNTAVGCQPEVVQGGAAGEIASGSMAVGDFNGDGKADLAVYCVNQINILLGKGDGTFQAPKTVQFPSGFLAKCGINSCGGRLFAADFNHDGLTDLAFNYSESAFQFVNELLIFLAGGDGSFLTPKLLAGVDLKAIADFNGDGFPDLLGITGVHSSPTDPLRDSVPVSVVLGKGDGTFGAPLASVPAGALRRLALPISMAMANPTWHTIPTSSRVRATVRFCRQSLERSLPIPIMSR